MKTIFEHGQATAIVYELNRYGYKNGMILKTKADLHLARKAWHFLGVLVIIALYQNSTRSESLRLAFITTFCFLAVDVLRQSIPTLNNFVFKVLGPIMREQERNKLAGTSWLLIGVTIIVFLFSDDVVTLSLLFLALGDPVASLIGVKYGKDKIVGNKTLQGTIAAFTVCFIISTIYFYYQNFMTDRILIVSVIAGLIGALSELIPILKLDDNFTYPVLSSSLLWGLFAIFGGA